MAEVDYAVAYLEKHGVEEAVATAIAAVVKSRTPQPLLGVAAEIQALALKRMTAPPQSTAVSASGRRRYVGGNFKCKGDVASLARLAADMNAAMDQFPADTDLVLCPSFLHIDRLRSQLAARIEVGAQNAWDAVEIGEFTGCVTAAMLADIGVKWLVLGHSDRRNTLLETPEMIATKAAAALKAGLSVNLTVGETKQQRDSGEYMAALYAQLAPVAAAIGKDGWERVVLAYEPVWAIGEGALPCSPDQAQEVHSAVRAWLKKEVSTEVAKATRIVYTGSVSADNAKDYAACPDINGFVCGRASLVAKDFVTVCRAHL